MTATQRQFYPSASPIDLNDVVSVPKIFGESLIKCRIIYDEIIREVGFQRYQLPHISSLAIVHCDDIDYSYKFHDRSQLHEAYKNKGVHDDIVIVKDGYITDSYFANLVFVNHSGYFTPTTPLLSGTRRERLIHDNVIQATSIRLSDIENYKYVTLINAMIALDEIKIPIKRLHY